MLQVPCPLQQIVILRSRTEHVSLDTNQGTPVPAGTLPCHLHRTIFAMLVYLRIHSYGSFNSMRQASRATIVMVPPSATSITAMTVSSAPILRIAFESN